MDFEVWNEGTVDPFISGELILVAGGKDRLKLSFLQGSPHEELTRHEVVVLRDCLNDTLRHMEEDEK